MSQQSRTAKALLWKERLQRFQLSNMTVVDFCSQEGISQFSFYYWRKRLDAGKPNTTPSTPSAFQSLHITPAAALLLIELPNGVRLQVPTDQLQLARTLVADLARLQLDGEH